MEKDIFLISTPSYTYDRTIPPMGIFSIAGNLEENGYRGRIEIIDGNVLAKQLGGPKNAKEKILNIIEEDEPAIVGVSTYQGVLFESLEILKKAQEIGAHAVAGAYGATLFSGFFAEDGIISVRGEAEETCKELFDALLSDGDLADIKGITFKSGENIVTNPDRKPPDINLLPPPAYHIIPDLSHYGDFFHLEESRGCVFDCDICSIRRFYDDDGKPTYRLKSPERLRNEVEIGVEMGFERMALMGELTLIERDRALEIANVMDENDIEYWIISAHPRLVLKQRNILPILKRKRLLNVEMGIEAWNQHSLDIYNKGTTPEINETALEILGSLGIGVTVDFINFNPFMTMPDLEKNIEGFERYYPYFHDIDPDYKAISSFWMPEYGTPLYEKAKEADLLEENMMGAYRLARYADEEVQIVYNVIRDFREKHYREISESADQVFKDVEDETNLGEYRSYRIFEKVQSLSSLPVEIIRLAYECTKSGIAENQCKEMMENYYQNRIEEIESGNYEHINKHIGVDYPYSSKSTPITRFDFKF